MKKLTTQQVMLLHTLLTQKTGGDDSLRDHALLDGALQSAYATFGGQDLFATVEQKGARLCFGLISNHAFADGNKRIGVLVLLTFLRLNGTKIVATNQDVIDLGLGVAKGSWSYDDVLEWITKHKN